MHHWRLEHSTKISAQIRWQPASAAGTCLYLNTTRFSSPVQILFSLCPFIVSSTGYPEHTRGNRRSFHQRDWTSIHHCTQTWVVWLRPEHNFNQTIRSFPFGYAKHWVQAAQHWLKEQFSSINQSTLYIPVTIKTKQFAIVGLSQRTVCKRSNYQRNTYINVSSSCEQSAQNGRLGSNKSADSRKEHLHSDRFGQKDVQSSV